MKFSNHQLASMLNVVGLGRFSIFGGVLAIEVIFTSLAVPSPTETMPCPLIRDAIEFCTASTFFVRAFHEGMLT